MHAEVEEARRSGAAEERHLRVAGSFAAAVVVAVLVFAAAAADIFVVVVVPFPGTFQHHAGLVPRPVHLLPVVAQAVQGHFSSRVHMSNSFAVLPVTWLCCSRVFFVLLFIFVTCFSTLGLVVTWCLIQYRYEYYYGGINPVKFRVFHVAVLLLRGLVSHVALLLSRGFPKFFNAWSVAILPWSQRLFSTTFTFNPTFKASLNAISYPSLLFQLKAVKIMKGWQLIRFISTLFPWKQYWKITQQSHASANAREVQ